VGSDAYISCIDVDNADTDGHAMKTDFPGEFEQMVLLAVLQLGDDGFALSVVRELDRRAGRRVSRGALYKTLERLEEKRFVEWEVENATPDRGGHPRRRFKVTRQGVAALQASRDALFRLWDGLDGVLGKPRP
jgi:DNA-binding PadR family transcriptional regulator